MKNIPIVSVILPFYRSSKTLAKAIQSVLNQSYTHFELILVANNPDEESLLIAQQFLANPKVRIIEETQQGVAHAMNTGCKAALGEWIARMDSDDEWLKNKLLIQMSFLKQHPNIEVVGCCWDSEDGQISEGFKVYQQWQNELQSPLQISNAMFIEMPIAQPSMVFKNQLLTQYGWFKSEDFPEDYEMQLRWHSMGVQMAKVQDVLLYWNDSKERLTRTNAAYTEEAFNRIKCCYISLFLKKIGVSSVWIWGAGRKTRRRAEVLRHHQIAIEGFIDVVSKETPKYKCIHYSELNPQKQTFVISFVRSRNASSQIINYLQSRLYVRNETFIMAS